MSLFRPVRDPWAEPAVKEAPNGRNVPVGVEVTEGVDKSIGSAWWALATWVRSIVLSIVLVVGFWFIYFI